MGIPPFPFSIYYFTIFFEQSKGGVGIYGEWGFILPPSRQGRDTSLREGGCLPLWGRWPGDAGPEGGRTCCIPPPAPSHAYTFFEEGAALAREGENILYISFQRGS